MENPVKSGSTYTEQISYIYTAIAREQAQTHWEYRECVPRAEFFLQGEVLPWITDTGDRSH
jgi:hypothetical protein